MTPHSSPDHRPILSAPRSSPWWRTALLVAAGVLVGTTPFVALGLEPDPVEPAAALRFPSASPAAIRELPGAERPSPAAVFPELFASPPVQATPKATPQPAPQTPATVPPAAPAAPLPLEQIVDVPAVLTDSYTWDERSFRVAVLQRVIGETPDGWYASATLSGHRRALEFLSLPTDTLPTPPPAASRSGANFAGLRQCESGGNYSAVSSSGRYRGAYQFDQTTWNSVAQRHDPSLVGVDPAAASRAAQDAMAAALYDDRGRQPWPVCGRHL